MAYYSAVLVADSGAWRTVDVDVEDAVDVDDLAEELRDAVGEDGAVGADGAVLVVLEREDEWFALVRADGPEPRTFVSDLAAVATSRFAALLAPAGDAPAPQPPPSEDGEGAAAVAPPTWAGDTALLTDLGLTAEELTATAESLDPAGALVEVGERCGFAGLLEALR